MEKRDVVLYLKPFQGATDEFRAALVESHSSWGRRKSLMTNVRWEGCLKGISSTSALMFPSRREKCQKVEHAFVCVCVCTDYGHVLRLTWLWLGSLRSSGKAFFAAPWKSSREARLKRGQKSKAQFLNPENWLFFMINMHSSCVTTFFPPQI